jgi:hypothetical protein
LLDLREDWGLLLLDVHWAWNKGAVPPLRLLVEFGALVARAHLGLRASSTKPICISKTSEEYIAYLGMEKGRVTPSVCRSTSVSHTTRNLRHVCRRFSIIDQCLSVTPPGICGTNAADFRSLINVCQSHHQDSAARMPQIFDH